MGVSGVLAGWRPITPQANYTPVSFESALLGLCGCQLPDGRGLLTWTTGGTAVRAAVLPSPIAWLNDNTVASGDAFDACTLSETVLRVACWEHGGDVFLTVLMRGGGTAATTIWQADDPSDPEAGFSLLSTVNTATYGGDSGTQTSMVGIPVAVGSRLVLPGIGYTDVGGIETGRTVGVWTSDDTGASWTRRLNFQFDGFGQPLDFMSAQTAPDASGNLHVWAYTSQGGTTNGSRMWRSTDNGMSWSNVWASGTFSFVYRQTFVRGSNQYQAEANGGVFELTGAGTDDSHWSDTGERWMAGSYGTGAQQRATQKQIIARRGIFGFGTDKVSFTPARPWHVGFVGSR